MLALSTHSARALAAKPEIAGSPLVIATGPAPDTEAGRPPLLVGPGIRVVPALSIRANRAPRTAFALDAVSGMLIGLSRGDEQWVLAPELGWSWRTPGAEQFLTAGLGIGRGQGDSAPVSDAHTLFGGVVYVPRFVVEAGGPGRARGLRHGFYFTFLENMLGAQLEHQILWERGTSSNDFRFGVSLDAGRLLLRALL